MAEPVAPTHHGDVAPFTFRSLVEQHLQPVLEQAGFAEGQWTVDESSVLFCADGAQYTRRYEHLADDHLGGQASGCVDIVIDGSLSNGITDFTVEFEPLGSLLARTGNAHAASTLDRLMMLDDPHRDALRIAAILTSLYADPGAAPPETHRPPVRGVTHRPARSGSGTSVLSITTHLSPEPGEAQMLLRARHVLASWP